jgi:hypothetical protein
VILWSLLPLLLVGAVTGGLGFVYWEDAVSSVRAALERWSLVAALLQWLESAGLQQLRTLLAPLIVVALAVPVIVVVTLLLVSLAVTPAVVRLVEARRFPTLARGQGAPWWESLFWALACTIAALLALILSLPLWLVPGLVMIVPPLIWGWLTYRVLGFDALALHATARERRGILRRRRWPLLLMGLACGYLGALPSLLWAASATTLIFAPLLVLVSVWLYTLIFAFASCWFAHFMLAELQRTRGLVQPGEAGTAPGPVVVAT